MNIIERRLYYVSDIHLEFRNEQFQIFPQTHQPQNVRNFLALVGDIGSPLHSSYEKFLAAHAPHYERIFLLIGNHEYYSVETSILTVTMGTIENLIKTITSKFSNITVLQKSAFMIEDTLFIGCTMWTQVNKIAEARMKEYKRIHIMENITYQSQGRVGSYQRPRLINYQDIRKINKDHVEWLTKTISAAEGSGQKIIVLTHHAPSQTMVKTPYDDMSFNAYVSPCDHLFKKPIVAWISGHTHESIEENINDIPSLSNCYGYPSQTQGILPEIKWITF
jgi:Icc-related predicted phosphoesterase